jgi:hypothetical protein
MTADRTVATMARGDDKEIRCTINVYKEREYVHLREYYKNESGCFVPTKRGVTFRLDEVPELFGMMKALHAEIKTQG